MNKTKIYLIFLLSMFLMPITVLFTEEFFDSFLFVLFYPAFFFTIFLLYYFKSSIKINQIEILKDIFWISLFINIINNVIICISFGFLTTILGMTHYDNPNITIFTHISFFSWIIGILAILFILLLTLFIRPFINHLDRSMKKIKQS